MLEHLDYLTSSPRSLGAWHYLRRNARTMSWENSEQWILDLSAQGIKSNWWRGQLRSQIPHDILPDNSLSCILTHKGVRILFVGIDIKVEDWMADKY